jgi:hypothetical protein
MPLVTLPQFTEMEAKIVGPLTFKQFLFILVSVVISIFLYFHLPHSISLPLAAIVFGIGIVFAFLKIGGIPFYNIFLAWLRSLFAPKTWIWGKKGKEILLLKEMEIKKMEKEKIGRKREGALKNLITKIETKK